MRLAIQDAGGQPDGFRKDLFNFLAEHANTLSTSWGARQTVVAEAHRADLSQLSEPRFKVAHVLLDPGIRGCPLRATGGLESVARDLEHCIGRCAGQIGFAGADNHIAGGGNTQADGSSILADAHRLPASGVYVDVAVGTLLQRVIGIESMAFMGEDRVPCERARAAIAAHRIAETHPFRGCGVIAKIHLEAVGWRGGRGKAGADADIASRIDHRAAGANGLESEFRVNLVNDSRYVVELRFQTMEFDIESPFTTCLHYVLTIKPVPMLETALVR